MDADARRFVAGSSDASSSYRGSALGKLYIPENGVGKLIGAEIGTLKLD